MDRRADGVLDGIDEMLDDLAQPRRIRQPVQPRGARGHDPVPPQERPERLEHLADEGLDVDRLDRAPRAERRRSS